MTGPVIVKFIGDKRVLMELINHEVLKPEGIQDEIICQLTDIHRLFDRVCELEKVLTVVRELVDTIQQVTRNDEIRTR